MLTLHILQTEHRNMWRLATAMRTLARELHLCEAPQAESELRTIGLILDYIDAFTDRFHHPKEDDFLFKLLAERDAAARVQIAQLQQQHRDGPKYRRQLRELIAARLAGDEVELGALQERIEQFCAHLIEHIRIEESTLMPLAAEVLTAQDWQLIDAAFADNDDPMFGANAQADMVALRSRIIHLAPAPLGLGGADYPAPAPMPVHAARPASTPAAADGPVVLEVAGLTSHYGGIQALRGIDLTVRSGQLVALVGANGAGKTTLLRAISGVQPVSGGALRLDGIDISGMRSDLRVRRGLGHVPEGRQVFGPMSIEDNIRLGAYTRPKAEIADGLERMYALFPILKEKRALPAGTLSGGQQQMLAMARALMGKPSMLLLDEPSMGLAPLLVDEIFRIVKELKAQGITILLVEQNAHAALSIADVGYVIETGKIILSGPGRALLENEQVKKAYLGI
jgi:branched-chain amino acid transport system ATP-binding protein